MRRQEARDAVPLISDPILAAPVTPGLRAVSQRWGPVLLVVAVLAWAVPAIALSGGITSSDGAAPADFDEFGCTSCHGPSHEFATGGTEKINWTITDPDGNALAGNTYEADVVYTINITLSDELAADAENHAGFNLRVSAGSLSGIDGLSQHADDQLEATHVDAGSTTWQVEWEAPAEGVAVFDLFVNDVDGSGSPDEPDLVYRVGFFLTDDTHALPGAAGEEHEVHVGVELPQYWLGLIALASMVLVIVFSFVYLKFMSPHHTNQKDR